MTHIEQYREHGLPVLLSWLRTLDHDGWSGRANALGEALALHAERRRLPWPATRAGSWLAPWLDSVSAQVLDAGFVIGFSPSQPVMIRFLKRGD